MRVSHVITPKGISLMVSGKSRNVDASSANYEPLKLALRKPEHDLQEIDELSSMTGYVKRASFGAVEVVGGVVLWNKKQVHNVIADRLIALLHENGDLRPLANFLGRVMQNPSETAQQELFLWLEGGNAPIDSEGYFLAFKRVRRDLKSLYDKKTEHRLGEITEMPGGRQAVDDNRHNTCSRGLHFAQYDYLNQYNSDPSSRTIVLRIDPADVVAIPSDYNNQKGRAWQYMTVDILDTDAQTKAHFTGKVVDNRYVPKIESVSEPNSVVDTDEIDELGDIERARIENHPDYEEPYQPVDNVVMADPNTFKPAAHTPRAITVEDALLARNVAGASTPATNGAGMTYAKSDEFIFKTLDGRTYTADEITAGVAKAGSMRGWARDQDLGKSTVQGWINRINGKDK